MKRKLSKVVGLMSFALLLSGCLNNLDGQDQEVELGPDEVVVQTTANQLSNEYYRSVILDNRYQLSASASADNSLSSAGNIFAFEEGLLRISQDIFPTDQYYMQEGQLIDGDTLTSWVSRESEGNPEGLNPALPVSGTQEEATEEAREYFLNTFSKGVVPENVPEVLVNEWSEDGIREVLIRAAGISSKSEFNRLLAQGGLSANGEKITRLEQCGPRDVVKVGRKQFYRLIPRQVQAS